MRLKYPCATEIRVKQCGELKSIYSTKAETYTKQIFYIKKYFEI